MSSSPKSLACRGGRLDIHTPAIAVKFHATVNERKDRIVPPKADVSTREKFRAALAKDDIASDDSFPSKLLYTKTFARAVAPILDASLSFFMSHNPELCADGFDL